MPTWPCPTELRAAVRLLCRPSPPLVPAARLQAAASLAALCSGRPVDPDLAGRLAAAILAWRRKTHGALVTFHAPEYPPLLRQIARPPVALFVVGDVACLQRPTVAVVGARAATAAARAWTGDFAGDLARWGIVVASGLARGIDAAAHEGALAAGGTTVAVLGCGPDLCYPPEHADLAVRIAASGALVSEFPPGTPPRPWHFPMRNRILSGLAAGVVVVQAERKSGALVTARQALEENRQVMAVPGDVADPRSRGPHELLRQGAALVDDARAVLEALAWVGPRDAPEHAASHRDAAPAGDARDLLTALGRGAAAESLRERLGWSAARLQRVLSELELLGLVESGPGGWVSPAARRC